MPDDDDRVEHLAANMWRAWIADNGGDVLISWEEVATKPYWRLMARYALVALDSEFNKKMDDIEDSISRGARRAPRVFKP